MAKASVRLSNQKNISGLLTKDSLTALGVNNPVMLDNIIQAQYRSTYGAAFSTIMDTGGKTRVVNKAQDGLFRWKLQGASAKWIPLIECRVNGSAITSTTKVGYAGSEFELVFPEMYFGDVDLIVGKKGSKGGQIQIKQEPRVEGTNWIYTCGLIAKSLEQYMTADLFGAGEKFSKEYPLVEKTLSKKGAGFNYSTSFEMENTYSKLRWQDTVAGNMFNRDSVAQFEIIAYGNDGKASKKITKWDSYVEFEQRMQMMAAKQRLLLYSRSNIDSNGNVINVGKSGFKLEQGSGLEEQMERGNYEYYNDFSLRSFVSFLNDLSDNIKGYGNNREVMVRTGKYGYQYAMQLIKQESLGFTPLQVNDGATKTGKDGGYKLDINFTTFVSEDGAIIKFYVDPALDDPSDARNSIMMSELDPSLRGPANSYTYQVMNVGSTGGESNVEIVYVEQKNDIYGVINGMRSKYQSYGSQGYATIAIPDDGFVTHYMTPEQMVIVRDPSRCLTYKPIILQ